MLTEEDTPAELSEIDVGPPVLEPSLVVEEDTPAELSEMDVGPPVLEPSLFLEEHTPAELLEMDIGPPVLEGEVDDMASSFWMHRRDIDYLEMEVKVFIIVQTKIDFNTWCVLRHIHVYSYNLINNDGTW